MLESFFPNQPSRVPATATHGVVRSRWSTVLLLAALGLGCGCGSDSDDKDSADDKEGVSEPASGSTTARDGGGRSPADPVMADKPANDTPGNTNAVCESANVEPCMGPFVTTFGGKVELGKYGAKMDYNLGAAFKNQLSIGDNNTICAGFAAIFGQEQAQTDRLLDTRDLDLSLYTVYRPAKWVDGEKYPIVTWGNGTCAQPEGYGALLRYVASHGFVVVAANSRYASTDNVQRHGLDFMFAANADPASPYYGRLDTDKVAAMGHSQGGMATVSAAMDERVKTAILFNGGSNASKPYLTISGDRDIGGLTADTLKAEVDAAPRAAYLFFHMIPGMGNADGHLTLMTQPERVTGPTVAWLKYILSDDAESKEWFVGASCKLCGHEAEYEYGQKGL